MMSWVFGHSRIDEEVNELARSFPGPSYPARERAARRVLTRAQRRLLAARATDPPLNAKWFHVSIPSGLIALSLFVGGGLSIWTAIGLGEEAQPRTWEESYSTPTLQAGVSASREDAATLAAMTAAVSDIPRESSGDWHLAIDTVGNGSLQYWVTDHTVERLNIQEPLTAVFQLPVGSSLVSNDCGRYTKWAGDDWLHVSVGLEQVFDGDQEFPGGPPITIACTIPAVGPVFSFGFVVEFTLPDSALPESPGRKYLVVGNPYWSDLEDPTSSWLRINERERLSLAYTLDLRLPSGYFLESSSAPAGTPDEIGKRQFPLAPASHVSLVLRSRERQLNVENWSQLLWFIGGVTLASIPSATTRRARSRRP